MFLSNFYESSVLKINRYGSRKKNVTENKYQKITYISICDEHV